MDEKGAEQWNNNIVLKLDLNTAVKVRRIIDDLINTLDFQHMSEIEVSDILSSIIAASGLSESETESKQKIKT